MEAQIVPQRIIDWSVDHTPKYEIVLREGRHIRVTLWIFRSWSGQRFLDGTEWHGPVYYLDTDEVAKYT